MHWLWVFVIGLIVGVVLLLIYHLVRRRLA